MIVYPRRPAGLVDGSPQAREWAKKAAKFFLAGGEELAAEMVLLSTGRYSHGYARKLIRQLQTQIKEEEAVSYQNAKFAFVSIDGLDFGGEARKGYQVEGLFSMKLALLWAGFKLQTGEIEVKRDGRYTSIEFRQPEGRQEWTARWVLDRETGDAWRIRQTAWGDAQRQPLTAKSAKQKLFAAERLASGRKYQFGLSERLRNYLKALEAGAPVYWSRAVERQAWREARQEAGEEASAEEVRGHLIEFLIRSPLVGERTVHLRSREEAERVAKYLQGEVIIVDGAAA